MTVVGTRWGSLIAASAASLHPEASLVLWEPLAAASRFFADAFMSRRVREVRRGDRPPADQELQDRLDAGESVDVVAHRLEPALHRRASTGRSSASSVRPLAGSSPPRSAPPARRRPDLAKLVKRWEQAGLHVEAIGLKGEETWWLVEERYDNPTERPVSLELIEITTSWITSTAEARA